MERDCSDEHEEGEIIDDFEDISDYSIHSTSYSGKSVSHRDLLQDVSLSSISDNEPDALLYVNTYNARGRRSKRRRRPIHCHRRKKHKSNEYYSRHKLHRYLSPTIFSSDSSDVELDAKTQKQLKDAVRIDKSEIQKNNSLRTRLNAMLQSENLPSKSEGEDEDVDALRALALLSSAKDENQIQEDDEKSSDIKLNEVDDRDEELIELRLAALKSAVLKKAPEIRKRKCKLQPNQNKGDICEVNKENNVNQENNAQEDADYIRTVESLDDIKKVNEVVSASETKNNDVPRNITIEEDIDIMRAKLLASMSRRITSDLPKEYTSSKEKLLTTNVTKSIHTHVNLYKKQVKVKPLIINLNDSDSDTDVTKKEQNVVNDKDIKLVNSVSEFLKKQRAAVEAKNKIDDPPIVKEHDLDKSVVKLLPKSQQREYHLLKQKLLMAKKKRFRKVSTRNENNKSAVSKKYVKDVVAKDSTMTNVKQSTESKPFGLQKALDDIQIKKNGRLQMKGKYKALAPLLQKVSLARVERKQCELEIKTLLENLQKARDKLATSQDSYTNLVNRLSLQKNAIDRRVNKVLNMKVINNNINIIKTTSTPVKPDIQESVCDISSIHNSQDNVKEDDSMRNEQPVTNCVQNIDKDPLPASEDQNNVLKQYVSPLDNKNRDTVEDPLITFCPFELFGVCKDPECKFNHCSNKT